MNKPLTAAIPSPVRVCASTPPGSPAGDAAAPATRPNIGACDHACSALPQSQPSIVDGETALETYDRMDMETDTNVTIAAIVRHYRQILAGCHAAPPLDHEGAS